MTKRTEHPTDKYCPRFGQLAVEMEYVTPEQLKQALADQVDDNLTGRQHRILGTIFFEKGWMTPGQVESVVKRMFKLLREDVPVV